MLDAMQAQGRNKACGFVGPFDCLMREGPLEAMGQGVNELFREAAKRGIYMGRVCGSGSQETPEEIEEAMVEAISNGCRLISVHRMSSDMTAHGARGIAEPFLRACRRCGFAQPLAPTPLDGAPDSRM